MNDKSQLVTNDTLNYDILLKEHSWLIKERQKAIISPDVDGVLCGLFMSSYYDWEIVGYYDGKKLAIKQGIKPSNCVFLDMEIYKKDVKSCGQHMVLYNKNSVPSNWDNFSNCINPNIIRCLDANKCFKQKYPFATIHLLLCIIGFQRKITIPRDAVAPLIYADGTFKNLLNYPENCISWLKFLRAKDESNQIYRLFAPFASQRISTIMHDMENIFREFKGINDGRRGGDKIRIDDIGDDAFPKEAMGKINKLMAFLSRLTGWEYAQGKWAFGNVKVQSFSKGIIDGNLNNKNYTKVINKNPVSFAITATKRMEYTLGKLK